MQRKNAVKNSRFRGYFFERATRTTFGISSSFERLQILFAAFARKKLDVQPHGAIPLRCGKNLVNIAQHHIGLDSLLMPEFHTGRQLSQFVLRDGGHDGQTKLRVLVNGIDVIILDKDTDSRIQ